MKSKHIKLPKCFFKKEIFQMCIYVSSVNSQIHYYLKIFNYFIHKFQNKCYPCNDFLSSYFNKNHIRRNIVQIKKIKMTRKIRKQLVNNGLMDIAGVPAVFWPPTR